ncbi:hypothetical protein MRB53_006373 [Persea americana]|uniref:Uncharacterized protein n=1 Tax=Persea americana TaxID=3435 RepID=A0ACC2MG43_PERAE|nr:hypothetical protein MRB53_006373 [Persea americana]
MVRVYPAIVSLREKVSLPHDRLSNLSGDAVLSPERTSLSLSGDAPSPALSFSLQRLSLRGCDEVGERLGGMRLIGV